MKKIPWFTITIMIGIAVVVGYQVITKVRLDEVQKSHSVKKIHRTVLQPSQSTR